METLPVSMRCHYCDRKATFAPKMGGVQVGLCDTHFRERFESLAESDALESLQRELDAEKSE
ncbi:DUF6757 family protein [Haladaptatus pallidirubidus]|uniref:Uncharacterized protein n=1 Tax=Haladaptatus pallidirubidus TaxID=1008152 RepID=A0AAV3UFL8_9EURY|nr:DUF6757 family protein [Haladaptatus pallidirubidus]